MYMLRELTEIFQRGPDLTPPIKEMCWKIAEQHVTNMTETEEVTGTITEGSTQTDAPPPPPSRSYAEAATQATPPPPTQGATPKPQPRKGTKGKGKATGSTTQQVQPALHVHPDRAALISRPPANTTPVSPTRTPKRPPPARPAQSKTIVLHSAPTTYKPGQMRRWIQEDNKGVTILGIRWLLHETRRMGKAASSLVIYLKEGININKGVRIGRRIHGTTQYDWDR